MGDDYFDLMRRYNAATDPNVQAQALYQPPPPPQQMQGLPQGWSGGQGGGAAPPPPVVQGPPPPPTPPPPNTQKFGPPDISSMSTEDLMKTPEGRKYLGVREPDEQKKADAKAFELMKTPEGRAALRQAGGDPLAVQQEHAAADTDRSEREAVASGAAAPPTFIPGAWNRTVSPDVLHGREEFEQNRGEALAQNEIDARLANEKARQVYADQRATIEAQQDAQQRQLAIAQQAHTKARDDYDAATKEAAVAKVDPDKFYGGAGGHILAAIATGLGAFGAALTKSPNFALEQIKAGVNASMEAQKEEMRNKQKGADNAYSRLLAATGDERAADSAFRMTGLQLAEAKAREIAPDAQNAALVAGLRAAQTQAQQDNLMFRMATEKYQPPQVIGPPGGGTQGAEADTETVFQLPDEMAGYPANTRFVAVGGKKSAEQLRNVVEANSVMQQAAKRVAELEHKHGQSIYFEGSDAHAQAMAEINAALGKVGALQGQSKLPIIDVELWKHQLMPEGNINRMGAALGVTSSLSNRIKAMADVANRETASTLRTHAVEEAHRHLTVGAGGVTPGAHFTGDAAERVAPKGFTQVPGMGGNAQERELHYKPEIRVQTAPPATKGKGKKKSAATGTEEVVEPEDEEDTGE